MKSGTQRFAAAVIATPWKMGENVLLDVSRRREDGSTWGKATAASSSIRTVTVGSGISPDLLTSFRGEGALAGSPDYAGIPPVGIFTPP